MDVHGFGMSVICMANVHNAPGPPRPGVEPRWIVGIADATTCHQEWRRKDMKVVENMLRDCITLEATYGGRLVEVQSRASGP